MQLEGVYFGHFGVVFLCGEYHKNFEQVVFDAGRQGGMELLETTWKEILAEAIEYGENIPRYSREEFSAKYTTNLWKERGKVGCLDAYYNNLRSFTPRLELKALKLPEEPKKEFKIRCIILNGVEYAHFTLLLEHIHRHLLAKEYDLSCNLMVPSINNDVGYSDSRYLREYGVISQFHQNFGNGGNGKASLRRHLAHGWFSWNNPSSDQTLGVYPHPHYSFLI